MTSRKTLRGLATVVAGLAVCAVAMSGIASAYWSSVGTGSGQASTGSAAITLSGATSVNGLYPGDSVTGVSVTVNNTGSAPVVMQSATGGTATISSAGPVTTGSACIAGGVVTFTATDVPSTPIAAGGHATVTGTVAMSTAAGNQCQGATFSIPVSVVARAG